MARDLPRVAPRARASTPKKTTAKAEKAATKRVDDLGTRIAAAVARAVPLIEKGNYPSVAAAATGTPTRTWTEWEARARAGDEPWMSAMLPVDHALAIAETTHVAAIVEPKKDYNGRVDATRIHSRQWMLERSRKARWGPRIELRMKLEEEFRELLTVRLRAELSAGAYEELVRALSKLEDEGELVDGE